MIAKPEGCRGCPLYAKGEGFVLPIISQGPYRLLIQGEAPGSNEAEEGKPFIGKAGHWLKQNILANAGVAPSEVFYDNTLRCLPPKQKNGEAYPTERQGKSECELHCRQYDVWDRFASNIPLLLVGGKAAAARLGLDGISNWHGHIQRVDGRLIGVTFHPSAVMRNPNYLPVVIRETQNLLAANRNPSLLDRPMVTKQYVPYHPGPMTFDLEWNPGTDHLTVVGVAYNAAHAYSTFHVEDGLEIVRRKLEQGERVIGHNIITADLPLISKLLQTGPQSYKPEHVFDTMVVAHLIHPHLAESGLLGLGDLVRYSFPTTDWKQDKADVLTYNGFDNAYNHKLYDQLCLDLDVTQQWHLIEKQQRLAHMTVLMHEQGIRIDRDALYDFAKARQSEKEEAKAGFPINPNSPQQVIPWVKTEFGIKIKDIRKETLKKLQGIDPKLDELIEFRMDNKSLSTWFPIKINKKTKEIEYVGDWIHNYFDVTGTAVARFSSSGPNLQNLPPRLRMFLLPPEDGMELWSFDAKNIENRTVAFMAGDMESLALWAQGYDPYTLTAVLMYGLSYDAIKADQKHWGDLNQKKKSLREQAKTTELASIYGETHYNLARRMFGNQKKDSLEVAQRNQNAFFKGRPKIREWHQRGEAAFRSGEIGIRNPFGRYRQVYASDAHEFTKRWAHFQGCSTAADIINSRALMVWDELKIVPMLIVHDELVYPFEKGETGLKKAKQVKEIMELPTPELDDLVVPTESKVGPNYGSLKEVEL